MVSGCSSTLDDKMVPLRSPSLVCVCGFDSRFLSVRVDVGVSGPFPCITPLFGGHLPLSVPVSVPVVVVVVVFPGRPVVMMRALFVAFIMVLLALFGPVVSCVVSWLLPSVVVVMVMVVVVPVRHWLVALLLLGMALS